MPTIKYNPITLRISESYVGGFTFYVVVELSRKNQKWYDK